MKTTPASLPLPSSAFARLSKQAQAEGLTLEAYLDSLTRRGFGVPLASVLSNVFEDAANAAAAKR
jgi:hypothetical protein